MAVTHEGEGSWNWQDVSPLTRAVVATFAGRPTNLHPNDYVEAIIEAVPGTTVEDVVVGLHWGNQGHRRDQIIASLSGPENTERVEGLLTELDEITGEERALAIDAAIEDVREKIVGQRPWQASTSLNFLSGLAVGQLMPTVDGASAERPLMHRPIH